MWTGYFLQSSALIYYYRYSLQKNEMAAVVATIMSIVPMFANLFVPFLSRQLGKRNLYSVTAFIQMAGLIVIMLSGTNDAMIIFGAIISAAGYGAKESIYFSMQADPVDYGEWKTGIQASGTLSSINGFLGKVAQAIAGGLSGLLLAIGGYVNGAAIQSTQTIISINAMYLYIPIILLICSMITMHFYTLDKELPSIQKDLKTRRLQMKE